MFKFLGQILGGGIRCQTGLAIDLAPIFWKLLIGDQVGLEDLKDFDHFTWQILDKLKEDSVKMTEGEFGMNVQ